MFSKEDMSRMIEDCIEDLKEGGSRMLDLSHLMNCIGETNNDKVLLAVFPNIGSFGSEIMRFRKLFLLPMMPPEMKKKYGTVLNRAIQAGQKSLESLKKILCEKNRVNYRELVSVLAMLNKHDYALAREWSILVKSRPSSRAE